MMMMQMINRETWLKFRINKIELFFKLPKNKVIKLTKMISNNNWKSPCFQAYSGMA